MINFRQYQNEDDFWKMREFLRKVFILNKHRSRSWHVSRLEYAHCHSCVNTAKAHMEDATFLWESDGQIIAFMMAEGILGEAFFAIHPELRTIDLEEEMLMKAEEHLASIQPDGSSKLMLWANEHDDIRQKLYLRHGYTKEAGAETQWLRKLDSPIQDAPLTPGFTIRSLGDGLELLERCYASGLGFHKGDIKTAVDNRNDPTWYRNIQLAPLYRRDLDLVVVAPDGAIASFCTIWFDDVSRSACFEPVATIPAYQKMGLAKALITDGLRRIQKMGAITAHVSGFSPGANALYQSVMGPDRELDEPWLKVFLPKSKVSIDSRLD